MINNDQINIVAKNLEKMENVQDAFDYLSNTFDLKNTKCTGFIVGPQFKKGMIAAIKLLNPPLKK